MLVQQSACIIDIGRALYWWRGSFGIDEAFGWNIDWDLVVRVALSDQVCTVSQPRCLGIIQLPALPLGSRCPVCRFPTRTP